MRSNSPLLHPAAPGTRSAASVVGRLAVVRFLGAAVVACLLAAPATAQEPAAGDPGATSAMVRQDAPDAAADDAADASRATYSERGRIEPVRGTDRLRYINTEPVCLSSSSEPQCPGERFVGNALVVRLPEQGTVDRIAIRAHDGVGARHRGGLRVLVDGVEVQDGSFLDTRSRITSHRLYDLAARGSEVIFEEVGEDEVEITEVVIEYVVRSPEDRPARPPHPIRRGTGEGNLANDMVLACIGGRRCALRSYEVALRGAAVREIRFHAHDDVGSLTRGRLRVSLDGRVVADDIDILAKGDWHRLRTDDVYGRRLVFEAVSDDEIVLEEIEVLYADGRLERWPAEGPPRN